MNFKQRLDRYLTEPPDDGFDGWAEDCLGNHVTPKFYDENEEWILEYAGQCNSWLNKLYFDLNKSPKEAAIIIERAFNIFIKGKQN